LIGGTLIDGFGSTPIRNSVIIVEGERIKAVGQVGLLEIPQGAKIISTEGMSVLPGLWDMHVHLMINGHTNYTHWDKKYTPIKAVITFAFCPLTEEKRDRYKRLIRNGQGGFDLIIFLPPFNFDP